MSPLNVSSKLYDISNNCVIAIDGTSASGKGTIAELLSQRFSLIHFQSSIIYRYLALQVLLKNASQSHESIVNLSKSLLSKDVVDSKELYSEDVTEMSSIVAAIPEVRTNLYHFQRDFLLKHPRVVMDGRDIGTVIAPDADIKIFISAELEVRANRRYQQLLRNGNEAVFSDVLEALSARDLRDKSRSAAPLLVPDGAIVIDTTNLSIEAVLENILQQISNL